MLIHCDFFSEVNLSWQAMHRKKESNDDLREINGAHLIFAKLMPRCFNAPRVRCVVLTIVYDYTTPRDGPKTKYRRPRQTFLVSDTKQQSEREPSEQ